MTYECMNKVWIPKNTKSLKREKILNTIMIVIFVLGVLQVIFSLLTIIKFFLIYGVSVSILMILKRKVVNGYYQDVMLFMKTEKRALHFIYEEIDRLDSLGVRREETTITPERAKVVYYCKDIKSVCVECAPIVESIFRDNHSNKSVIVDYQAENKEMKFIVYFFDETEKYAQRVADILEKEITYVK